MTRASLALVLLLALTGCGRVTATTQVDLSQRDEIKVVATTGMIGDVAAHVGAGLFAVLSLAPTLLPVRAATPSPASTLPPAPTASPAPTVEATPNPEPTTEPAEYVRVANTGGQGVRSEEHTF